VHKNRKASDMRVSADQLTKELGESLEEFETWEEIRSAFVDSSRLHGYNGMLLLRDTDGYIAIVVEKEQS
jgi:hypothetical protein